MIEEFLASKRSLYKIVAIGAFGDATCKPGSSIMTVFCTATWNGLRAPTSSTDLIIFLRVHGSP